MQLATPEEVMQIFKISKTTLYNKSRSGAFPHFRIGASLRYDVEELRKHFRKESRGRRGSRNLTDQRARVGS